MHTTQTLAERLQKERDGRNKKQKRKMSAHLKIKKKAYDQARGRNRVNIGEAYQRWRELKERKGLTSDHEVALFLLDR